MGVCPGCGTLLNKEERVGDLNFTWEFELMNCQVNTFVLVQWNTYGSRSMDKFKGGGGGRMSLL